MSLSISSKFAFRRSVNCPLFGPPTDFSSQRVLPTYKDVIACCLHERWVIGSESGGNREPHFSAIVERVATKLEQIYEAASIPTVSRQRIIAMMQSYHKRYISIKDVIKRENESQTVKARIAVFKQEAENLFDVTACKCLGFNELCRCPKEKKVPKIEQQFLID